MGADGGTNGPVTNGPSSGSLRMLVVLRATNMDRITEGLLRCALDAGHSVHVALDNAKDRGGRAAEERSLFDVLEAEYPDFSYGALPPREELWLYPATKLRSAIDFLRYFEPEFEDAATLRRRAAGRAPWYVRLPAALRLLRLGPVRRAFSRFLRAVERRLPVSKQSLAVLRKFEPDVVVVSPLVETGSAQGDHLRAADRLGIPTVLVVASWDNLTTKGVIRDVPDATIVWNSDQVREAVDMHGLPAASIVATGAHSHDHWFAWEPSTSRDEFAAKVGLDPERRFLLYVCSSGFIVGDDEVEFVREWAGRLWASDDSGLRNLGVLVRPHPQNFDSWHEAEIEEPGRMVVWPRGGVAPTDPQSKRDYFDSLHHAQAVVGINTTALVDSAIVRRPVFTMVGGEFRGTQTGTLHFSYLAREGNGLLNIAESWEAHFDQLAGVLGSPDGQRKRIDGFLESFVRPRGLDRPAAPLALEEIVSAARADKQPVHARGPIRWVVGATARALGAVHLVAKTLRPRALRKQYLRRRKSRRAGRALADRERRETQRAAAQEAKRSRPPKPSKPEKAAKREKAGAGSRR